MKPAAGKAAYELTDEASGFGLMMDVADMDPLDGGEHGGGGGGHGSGAAEKLQDADFFNGAARRCGGVRVRERHASSTAASREPRACARPRAAASVGSSSGAERLLRGLALAFLFVVASPPRP
jgi:hypothetical protein